MRRPALSGHKGKKMQDVPIHCPADVDATEVERMACDTPAQKPDPTTKPGSDVQRSGGGGKGNPPEPDKK